MNPFLKHPILQFVGYEMMKRPTLDGIKVDLLKQINNPKSIYVTLLSIFFGLYGIYKTLVRNNTIGIIEGIVYIFIGIGWIVIAKLEWKNKKKRFAISNEEIIRQIEIHKKWSSNKSK